MTRTPELPEDAALRDAAIVAAHHREQELRAARDQLAPTGRVRFDTSRSASRAPIGRAPETIEEALLVLRVAVADLGRLLRTPTTPNAQPPVEIQPRDFAYPCHGCDGGYPECYGCRAAQ